MRRAARAPSVRGATRGGGGATAARRPRGCGQAQDPRNSDSDPRPPVATIAAPVLSAFLFRALSSSTPLEPKEQNHWGAPQGGARGQPAPTMKASPCCFQTCSQTSVPVRCSASSLHPAPASACPLSPRKALHAVSTSPPTPPWPPLSLSFPERQVRGQCFVGDLPVNAALLLGFALLLDLLLSV